MRATLSIFALLIALAMPAAAQMDYQPPPDLDPLHRPYDQLLDTYNRDGILLPRAQAGPREAIGYVTSLDSPAVTAGLPTWDKPRQIAFWINAYNALALQTAINHYPAGMQQVPGGFTRSSTPWRGRA
jgi:hypothetical protein